MNHRTEFFIFILCLLSCSHVKKDMQVNQPRYIIDLDKAERVDHISLSELCSNMKTIILETNDSVLIKQDGGMQVYKDYIFVLDTGNDGNLYAFNKEGKFIRKYGSKGNGPGEYLLINDFTIDPENEIVYLMDVNANQILMYDINTGKYINTIKLERKNYNCMHIQYNKGKLYTDIDYWYVGGTGCMLQEIDPLTGKQKQCWLDPQYNMGWNGGVLTIGRMEESFFYERNQEECKYIQYFTDTIISIGKNQIEPYAVIKSKDWITSKDLSKIIAESNNDSGRILPAIREKGFLYNINSFMEWNDFICFYYIKNSYIYFVLYNKKTGNARFTIDIINDIGYNKPELINRFACSDANGLYQMIGMFSINRYLERIREDGYLKKDVDKYEQLRNLPDDTNPVVFYYEFK